MGKDKCTLAEGLRLQREKAAWLINHWHVQIIRTLGVPPGFICTKKGARRNMWAGEMAQRVGTLAV